MKKILLITTGGTIASKETVNGLAPSIDARQILSYIPGIEKICRLSGISIMSVDSTNMNPELMKKIAETIRDNYGGFDGFVVTHGTDTMGYTASALTYMLRFIDKPVVMTGSQTAICEPDTDAKKNLCDAIMFACEDVRGVFVAFGGKIIIGTHAVKLKTRSAEAFGSVNFPAIATIESEKVTYNSDVEYSSCLKKFKEHVEHPLKVRTNLCGNIIIIKMFPGIEPDIFNFIKGRYKGVILESFGIGGIPNRGNDIVSKVHELTKAGIAVAVTTQCMYEGIDLDIYAVGRLLAKQKIIYAADMTTEALTMKLMWALGNYSDVADVKSFIETPISEDRNY